MIQINLDHESTQKFLSSSRTRSLSNKRSTKRKNTPNAKPISSALFLTPETAKASIECAGGSPTYVYSQKKLNQATDECLAFPNAYGLTVRFAMKACPNAAILKLFHHKGIHIDASSGNEAKRAISAGIPPENISLSTQELPNDFANLANQGVKINICSISQLQRFGQHYQTSTSRPNIGLRINPGIGSGGFSSSQVMFSKTNVGGPESSFGIWYEMIDNGHIQSLIKKYNLVVERIHTHIGSGSDPQIWQDVAHRSLKFCKEFSSVNTLNLGGGYKVARFNDEKTTDLQLIGKSVKKAFQDFADQNDNRQLHLEIEPGTYLIALAGALVTSIQDKVSTGKDKGHTFLKLDSGMNDLLRPSLYGARHAITLYPKSNTENEEENVVIVGHCCESGDLFTPEKGKSDHLSERSLPKGKIGDILVIDGSGAYGSSMATTNYNSFPEIPEVLLSQQGEPYLIRKRQSLEQIIQNEIALDDKIFAKTS